MASRNPALREVMSLRVPEADLSNSRQLFINNQKIKHQFEADCAQIIPVLDRFWTTKILEPFGLSLTTSDGCEPADTIINVPNFKHFLYNYTPQMLVKAITRLASRMGVQQVDSAAGTVCNERGVINIVAYYKALVQDMRKKELRRELKAAGITLTNKVPPIECQSCFDEVGSYTCVRPAHRTPSSMEDVAFNIMDDWRKNHPGE